MELDTVRLNFSEDSKILLNLTIAIIMFGIALELKPSDFKTIFREPRPVLAGVISQFLLMPFLTFLVAISLKNFITPTVGLGMILVAACPGGNISNFISSLARGNVALSVGLTAFSSLAALVLTPFNFTFWGNLFMKIYASGNSESLIRTLEIDPLNVLLTILMILGVPLILGIFFSHNFKAITYKILIPIKRFSILAFLAMVVIIFTKNYDLFINHIQFVFIIVLIHNLLALTLGYYTAAAFRVSKKNRKTISIETGIQNSGLALALLFNPLIFPVDLPIGGMAFIAAWWGVWHIVSGLVLAGYWSNFSLRPTIE